MLDWGSQFELNCKKACLDQSKEKFHQSTHSATSHDRSPSFRSQLVALGELRSPCALLALRSCDVAECAGWWKFSTGGPCKLAPSTFTTRHSIALLSVALERGLWFEVARHVHCHSCLFHHPHSRPPPFSVHRLSAEPLPRSVNINININVSVGTRETGTCVFTFK